MISLFCTTCKEIVIISYMDPIIYKQAEKLWDYLSMEGVSQKCDVLFVLGRDDTSIPAKAVEVYKKGLAKKVILLGGRGRLTGGIVGSESEAFKKYLLAQGVPEEVML